MKKGDHLNGLYSCTADGQSMYSGQQDGQSMYSGQQDGQPVYPGPHYGELQPDIIQDSSPSLHKNNSDNQQPTTQV